jgi:hypothetical protein
VPLPDLPLPLPVLLPEGQEGVYYLPWVPGHVATTTFEGYTGTNISADE